MKLCILTPIKAAVLGPCHLALVDTAIALTKLGIEVFHKTTWQGSYIPMSRNALVKEAMASGADKVLWIDDDILFKVEDVQTILSIEADIVSGSYKEKRDNGAIIGYPLENGKDKGELMDMESVGMGFCLMARNCLQKMTQEYGEHLFEPMRHENGNPMSEDYSFCQRWRKIDGKIWMHTGIRLGHIGFKVYNVS